MRKEPDPSKSLCLFQLPSFPSEPPAADRRNKKITKRRRGGSTGMPRMTRRDEGRRFGIPRRSSLALSRSSISTIERYIERTRRVCFRAERRAENRLRRKQGRALRLGEFGGTITRPAFRREMQIAIPRTRPSAIRASIEHRTYREHLSR